MVPEINWTLKMTIKLDFGSRDKDQQQDLGQCKWAWYTLWAMHDLSFASMHDIWTRQIESKMDWKQRHIVNKTSHRQHECWYLARQQDKSSLTRVLIPRSSIGQIIVNTNVDT